MKTAILLNPVKLYLAILLALFGLAKAEALANNMGAKFTPVEANEIPEILTMISNRTQSNYDRIESWQGELKIVSDYVYEGDRAKEVFTEDIRASGQAPKRLLEHRETNIEFSLDVEEELLYAKYYSDSPKPLQYINLENRRHFEAKVILATRAAILAPEYQIDCMVDTTEDGVVKGREGVKQARPETSSTCARNMHPVYDPRASFKPFGNQIWELSPGLVEAIKKRGKYSVDEYDLKVEERRSGNITEYRIILPSKGGSPESYQYFFFGMTFSSDKGFNIVSLQETDQNGILLRNRAWDYELIDGVYVPIKTTQQDFNWPNGTVRHETVVTFKNQKVNGPIPDVTFTYRNLGLKNGDKFIDKILDKEYIYQDGQLIPLARKK
jgi:hypothetical protein